jgi:hypothetical protein
VRALTPDFLWENVELFMKMIDKLSSIQPFLQPAQSSGDRAGLTELLGPHYSTTFPKDPAVLSDALKARLVIPPPPPI